MTVEVRFSWAVELRVARRTSSARCLDLHVVLNQPPDSPTTRNTETLTSTRRTSCKTAAKTSPAHIQITQHDARTADHHCFRPPGYSMPATLSCAVSCPYLLTPTSQLYLSAFFGLVPLPAKIQADVIPVVRLHTPSNPLSLPAADTLLYSFPSGPSCPLALTSWANSATASSPSRTNLKRTRNS